MDIQALKKLVDEKAISYMIKNEKEIEAQYNSFINNNKIIIGIDLASGKDVTIIQSPHKLIQYS